MRRTLRASLRTGGDPIRLARRRRRVVRRRLVMLCDISGSMEPYARAYLQFLTCAARSGPNAEAFVFATRLTRLTRALAGVINILDPEAIVLGGGLSAIAALYDEVPRLWRRFVFSDEVATRLLPPVHGDSSGVRGAAWLWPPETYS